jgi:hypothetical protein
MENPPFVIRELDGARRRIVLSDRARPYRPLKFQGTQQLEQTWYPGYDRATVQVLGPHEENTTVDGMWKDRFLAGAVGGSAPAKVAEEPITAASDLVELFDGVRRSGVRLQVTWGPVARVGYLRSFSHTWTTVHDCAWEMEFIWSTNVTIAPTDEIVLADTNVLPLSRVPVDIEGFVVTQRATGLPLQSRPSWFQQIQTNISSAASSVRDVVSQASSLGQPVSQTARQISGLIGSLITESLAIINQASSTGLDVLGVANSVGSTVGSFQSLPILFMQQWSQVVQGAGVTMASLNPSETDPTSVLSSVFYQSEAQRLARAQVRLLQDLQSQINASLEPVPDTLYVTRDGDNLRGISTLFYGTPGRWTEIQEKNKEALADYNESSNVPAGLPTTRSHQSNSSIDSIRRTSRLSLCW